MTSPAPLTPDDEWPAQAADAIVRVVDSVKQKTTVPAETAAKALIYGPAIALFGTVLLVVLTLAFFRGFERLLIWIGEVTGAPIFEQPMWMVYVFVGVVFTLSGGWLLRKSRR
jgi:hypothetical protein